MIKIKSIQLYNYSEKFSESENEDAIAIQENDDFQLIAISDGAGGVGIFCKEWANHLVINQPPYPVPDLSAGKEWFLKLSKSFYESQIKLLNLNDPFVREKFHEEGSYATMLYCWFSVKEKQLFYSGIGDTILFYFQKINGQYCVKLIFPTDNLNTLTDHPQLLNWSKEMNYDLSSNSILFNNGDKVLLCSDSFARWIIINLLIIDSYNMSFLLKETLTQNINKDYDELKIFCKMKYNFLGTNNLLAFIEDIIEAKDKFENATRDMITSGELEKDDYTIINIDIQK